MQNKIILLAEDLMADLEEKAKTFINELRKPQKIKKNDEKDYYILENILKFADAVRSIKYYYDNNKAKTLNADDKKQYKDYQRQLYKAAALSLVQIITHFSASSIEKQIDISFIDAKVTLSEIVELLSVAIDVLPEILPAYINDPLIAALNMPTEKDISVIKDRKIAHKNEFKALKIRAIGLYDELKKNIDFSKNISELVISLKIELGLVKKSGK
jgi:hypothetical protein